MIKAIKRFLLWQLCFLLSMYAPIILTGAYLLLLNHFFPDGPFWTVGVFALVMIFVFARYCKF